MCPMCITAVLIGGVASTGGLVAVIRKSSAAKAAAERAPTPAIADRRTRTVSAVPKAHLG